MVVKTRSIVRLTPTAASNRWSPKKFVACPIMLAMMVGAAVVIIKPEISRSSTIFPCIILPFESKCTLNKTKSAFDYWIFFKYMQLKKIYDTSESQKNITIYKLIALPNSKTLKLTQLLLF